MSDQVGLKKIGAIGVITVDYPPVNALGAAVRDGLMACLNEALADPEIKAMVLLGAARTFIAGADIREFGKPRTGTPLPAINEAYEYAEKPIVAAIHGTALGGGLEVALCCHYRYAVPSAQVGLPEVKLGLLPGAGGTQRLPRLVGVETALDLIVNGRFVRLRWNGSASRAMTLQLRRLAVNVLRLCRAAPSLRQCWASLRAAWIPSAVPPRRVPGPKYGNWPQLEPHT